MRIASLRPSMCLMDRVEPKSELAEKDVDDEAFSTKHDVNDCWSWTVSTVVRSEPQFCSYIS